MNNNAKSNNKYYWLIVGIVYTVPYLGLALFFISPVAWGLAIYATHILLVAVAIYWLIYCGIESIWRHKKQRRIQKIPWFSLCGFMLFLMLPLIESDMMCSLMGKIPQWSYTSQTATWQTSADGAEHGTGYKEYILVYSGDGNIQHHKFTRAHLNWTGKESAGLSNIDLHPVIFGYWGKHEYVSLESTKDNLRKRIENTKLPKQEIDLLTNSIWQSITEASINNIVTAPHGSIDNMFSRPYHDIREKVGLLLWSIFLILVFLTTSFLSITKPARPDK